MNHSSVCLYIAGASLLLAGTFSACAPSQPHLSDAQATAPQISAAPTQVQTNRTENAKFFSTYLNEIESYIQTPPDVHGDKFGMALVPWIQSQPEFRDAAHQSVYTALRKQQDIRVISVRFWGGPPKVKWFNQPATDADRNFDSKIIDLAGDLSISKDTERDLEIRTPSGVRQMTLRRIVGTHKMCYNCHGAVQEGDTLGVVGIIAWPLPQ